MVFYFGDVVFDLNFCIAGAFSAYASVEVYGEASVGALVGSDF